jgi:hypothetical protein
MSARLEERVDKLAERLDRIDRGDDLPRWAEQLIEEGRKDAKAMKGEIAALRADIKAEFEKVWGDDGLKPILNDFKRRDRRRKFFNSVPGRITTIAAVVSAALLILAVVGRYIVDPILP